MAAVRMAFEQSFSYTALSEAQAEQQRQAAAALLAGRADEALAQVQALNRQLEHEERSYTVRPGDSLWLIAGRPEVYNNGWLWPLLWDANRDELRSPQRVFPGMVLDVRAHPTLDEIARALDRARAAAGLKVRIGEIREVPPGAP